MNSVRDQELGGNSAETLAQQASQGIIGIRGAPKNVPTGVPAMTAFRLNSVMTVSIRIAGQDRVRQRHLFANKTQAR
jgi:hypothetical protein